MNTSTITYEYAIYDGEYWVEATTFIDGQEHALRTSIPLLHSAEVLADAEDLITKELNEVT